MKAKAYIVHRAMCEPELEWSKPKDCLSAEPLYTSPPASKPCVHATTWRGLTDVQIGQVLDDPNIAEPHQGHWRVLPFAFARAIEAKLREKNTR